MVQLIVTGFSLIDRLLERDKIVEFYSEDAELLEILYHRVAVLSSPIYLLVVGEHGGLDPSLILRFQRITGKRDEIFLRRAFKAEDVSASISAFDSDKDLIIINPYVFGKEYTEVVGEVRKRKGKTFIFSLFNREKRGSVFGLHTAHSIIRVDRSKRGFKFVFIKHVYVGNIEVPFGFYDLYAFEEREGLLHWMIPNVK